MDVTVFSTTSFIDDEVKSVVIALEINSICSSPAVLMGVSTKRP